MKTQVVSVVLSLLLCSTLAHDYHRARQLQSHFRPEQKHLTNVRDASTDICELVCTAPSVVVGLQIVFNVTTQLLGVVNVTSNVALVLDIQAGIVAVLNGNTGAGVIINIETGVGVHIAAGVSAALWLASKVTLDVFVNGLVSLQAILNLKIGVAITLTTVTDAALTEIATILGGLAGSLSLAIKAGSKVALTVLISVSKALLVVVKAEVSSFLSSLGSGLVKIQGDLIWLINVLGAVGKVLAVVAAKITGGLAALIKLDIAIKLALILQLSSGIERLVALLGAIGEKVALDVAGGILLDAGALILIIAELGGSVYVGLDGAWNVIAHVVAFINKNVSLHLLINVVLQAGINLSGSVNLTGSVGLLLDLVKAQEVKWNNSAALSGLVTIVKNIQANALVIANINVSAIIAVIQAGAASALNLLVAILVQLKAIVDLAVSLPQVLLHLVGLINSVIGINLLVLVVPGLAVSSTILAGGVVNIAAELFKSVSIVSIISGGLSITNILSKLPVVGPIIVALSGAISASAGGSISLSSLVLGSAEVVVSLTAWVVKSISGLASWLPIPSGSVTDANAVAVQGFGSFGISLSVGVSAGISTSGSAGASVGRSHHAAQHLKHH